MKNIKKIGVIMGTLAIVFLIVSPTIGTAKEIIYEKEDSSWISWLPFTVAGQQRNCNR